jgi:hypothetical protein
MNHSLLVSSKTAAPKSSVTKKHISTLITQEYTHLTKFIPVCLEVKGLTLNQALLQLSWNRKIISQKFQSALEEFIVIAKEKGYNLDKTYIGIDT